MVEGPAARGRPQRTAARANRSFIQGAFSENWGGETGQLFIGEAVFSHLEPCGNTVIHAAYLKPERSAPAVKILHHAAICLAQKRIWIQNPYFIPKPEAIEALGRAVQRGVDIRVLMPSLQASDNPIVQYAARRNFEKLLRCGVRLFEYPQALLHQKIMTIDEAWSAVGSSNFDDRSLDTNDELTLSIFDFELASSLDGVFLKYAQHADEIEPHEWKQRSIRQRMLEQACYSLRQLL